MAKAGKGKGKKKTEKSETEAKPVEEKAGKKGKKDKKKNKKGKDLQKEKLPKGKPPTPPLKKCLIAPDVEIEYLATQRFPASKMDFQQYFRFLTQEILAQLYKNKATLDAEKGMEFKKTNISDLPKNPDVLKIVMKNLKRLLTRKRKGQQIFKYICQHLNEILEDVKKLPRCVRSEPDIIQFYQTLERDRANKCLKAFFNFPHKRNRLNIPKAWSSPRLLVPEYSLFQQIDKIIEKETTAIPVNIVNEKSAISLAVGEYLFNEQLPQGFIDRFTIFTYDDLDVLMKAPRVFAEELLSVILKKISVKDSVRRYTVDLLMSCINFALNQKYNQVQLSICLTSFLIAHYYYLKHRYDNFDNIFEAFFVNFAYMNYQATKYKCRTFIIRQARDVVNCFVKLYMQQLPLIASLLHESKKLIIADVEAETEFSDEHSSQTEMKAADGGKVETLGAPVEEWSVFHNLPIFTDFDPNRFIKFKKDIKKIKYQQEKERNKMFELGPKRRSGIRTNLQKKVNTSRDYFIEIFFVLLNNQDLLNDVKFEPLKENSFKQMWTESTSTLESQLSRVSDSLTSRLSFWKDSDGKYLHFLFDHFGNEQTESTIVLWGSGETSADSKTIAEEAKSLLSEITVEPFEDFFMTTNDEEASTMDYSCTKLCEHQPYRFNKLLSKFITEFKLSGPNVEEDSYLEDDRKHVDIFTMIADLPMYGKVLRTGFHHTKKKRFVNYNNLRNLGHLLDEIYYNKYICPEKKLIVYDNLKRYFHNFRKRNRYVGPSIWHDPLVNCGLEKYENRIHLEEDLDDYYMRNYYDYFIGEDLIDDPGIENADDFLTYPTFVVEKLILERYFKTCHHYLNNNFDVLKDIKVNKEYGKIKFKHLETSSDDNIDEELDKYKIVLNRKDNRLFKLNLLNNMYNTIGEHGYFNREFVVKHETLPKDIDKYIVQYNKRHSITPDDDNVCEMYEQSFDLFEELDEFYGGEQYNEEIAVEENNSVADTETSLYNYYCVTDRHYLKKAASQFEIFNRPECEFYTYSNELMLRLYKEESRLDDVQLYNLDDYRLIDLDVFDQFDFDNEQCIFYDTITPTTKHFGVCKDNEPSCKIIDSHFYEFKTKEEESIRWRYNERFDEEPVTKEYLNIDPNNEDYMFYKIPKRKLEDFSDDIITWIFVDVVEGDSGESVTFFDLSHASCLFGGKKINKPKSKRKRRVNKGIRYSSKDNVIDMSFAFEDCMKSCMDPNKFITVTKEEVSLVDRNKSEEIEVPDVALPDKFYTAVQSYEIAKLKLKVILHLMKTDILDCPIKRTISLPAILYRTFNDFINNRIKLPRRCYSMETLVIPEITIWDELKNYKKKTRKRRVSEIDYEKIDRRLKEIQEISGSNLMIKSTIFDTKPSIISDSWSNVISKIKKGLLIDDILTKDDNLFKIQDLNDFFENINLKDENLDYVEFWDNYQTRHQSKLRKKQEQVIEKKEVFKRRPLYYNEKVEKIKQEGDICKEYVKSVKQFTKQKQVKTPTIETQSEILKKNFELYDKLLEEELNALCGQQDSSESQAIIRDRVREPATIDGKHFSEVVCDGVLNSLSNENLIDAETVKEPKTVLEQVIEDYMKKMQSQESKDLITIKKHIYDQFYKTIKPILIKSKIQTEIFSKYSIIKKIIREYINSVIRSYEENLTDNIQHKLPNQQGIRKKQLVQYPIPNKKLLKPKLMKGEETEIDGESSVRLLQEKSIQVDIGSTSSVGVKAEQSSKLSELDKSGTSICESGMKTLSLPDIDREFSKSDIIWLRKHQLDKFCKSEMELPSESEMESEYTMSPESYTESGDEVVQMYGYRTVMSPYDDESDNILSSPALINVTKKGAEVEIDLTDENELPNDYFKDGNKILDYDLKNIERSGAYRAKRYLLIPGQEGDENMLILQMYPSWMKHAYNWEMEYQDIEGRHPFTNKPNRITDALDRVSTDPKSFLSVVDMIKEPEVTPAMKEDSRDSLIELAEKSAENIAFDIEDAHAGHRANRRRRHHWEREPLEKLLQKIEFKNVKDSWLKELKRELLKEVVKNKQSSMQIEYDEDVDMFKLMELIREDVKLPGEELLPFVQEEAVKSQISAESTISYDLSSKDEGQSSGVSIVDKADKTEDADKKPKGHLEKKLYKKLLKMKESDFKIILDQLYYFKHRSKYLPYEELKDLEGKPTLHDIVKTKESFEEFIRNVAKTLKIPKVLDKTQFKKYKSNFERFGPIYKYDILTRELRQKYSIEELDLEEFDELKFDYFNVNDIIEIFFGKVASVPEDSLKDYELQLLDTLIESSETDVLYDHEMIKFIDDIDEELIDNYLDQLSYDENLWEIIDDYLKVKEILKENLLKTKLNACDELKLMEMHDKTFRRSSTLHDRKSLLSIASCQELLKQKKTGGKEVWRKSVVKKQRKSIISTDSHKPIKDRTIKSQEKLLKQIIEQKASKKLKEKPEISKDPLENYEKLKEFIEPMQPKKIPVQEKKALYKQYLDYLTAMHDQLYQILTTENQIFQKQIPSIQTDKITNFKVVNKKSRTKLPNLNRNFDRQRELETFEIINRDKKKRLNKSIKLDRKYFNLQELPRNF